MRLVSMAAAAAVMATAMPVAAVTFNVTAPGTTAIPNNNNFKSQLTALVPSLTRFAATGATISLSGAATVKFEYLGSESGFKNAFSVSGGTGFSYQEMSTGLDPWNAAGTPIGTVQSYAAGAITNWFFGSPGRSTPGPFGIGTEQFGIFLPAGQGSYSSNVLYLGFDDEPGSDDDNHDDMIIRVTAEDFGGQGTVPEPASWAMLIAGFGLVGAVSRRRRGAASTAA